MSNQTKANILAAVQKGHHNTLIAFNHNVSAEHVQAVKRAYRDVLVLRKSGVDPKVLWANYRDLLTAKVCGVLTEATP